MKRLAELLALIRFERDSVAPFFDPYAPLGSAYDDLRRMERAAEFDECWDAAVALSDSAGLHEKLRELKAARAWLLHMALAFSTERSAGKWPEVLKHEALSAVERLDVAIKSLG